MTRVQGAVEAAIRTHVADHPDDTWLTWKDTEFTWLEVLSNAQRAANGLLELGVNPGDRVALMLSNCPQFIWAHLGILMIGAHSVPVNISQRGVTLEHILADSDATTVIFQPDVQDAVLTVASSVSALKHLVTIADRRDSRITKTFDELMTAPDIDPPIDLAEPSGGVGMMYTSGTTGPPKGVVATGYDITPMLQLLRTAGIGPGDTMYTGLPLFHGNALLVSMLGSIMLGAKLALAPKFTASGIWEDCRRSGAVEFNALGGMISILLKQPPRPDDRDHPVHTVISAGCPPNLWREFESRFGVRLIEWFGMVDSPGLLLNADGRVGSMGRSGIAGIDFRVVDETDEDVAPGVVGELVFRHPRGRLTYYHGLPDATEEAYRNGWFHSGDLAEFDSDGYFYYCGRKKASIRRLGENISAWEVETVVNSHPDVLECGAYAVPSELSEDEVKVCIVPRPGSSPDPRAVLDYCTERLARYAIPRYVEFVDQLPKTATERIQYEALKSRGLNGGTWDASSGTFIGASDRMANQAGRTR